MTPWTFAWQRTSRVGATCSTCDVIHSVGDTIAVDRFNPAGPAGYRTKSGGPIRATRAEAMKDLCTERSAA